MDTRMATQSFGSPSDSASQDYEVVVINDKKYFNCTYPGCGKTFKFYSEIKRHLLIHYHERPFVCTFPHCNKSFKRADALTNHIRVHSKLTPFECPVEGCQGKFTTKSAMRYHLLRHAGEKIFTCSHDDCQKTFFNCSQHNKQEKTPLSSMSPSEDETVDSQISHLEQTAVSSKKMHFDTYSDELNSFSPNSFNEDLTKQNFFEDSSEGFFQPTFEESDFNSTKFTNSPAKSFNEDFLPSPPPMNFNLEGKLDQAMQENQNLHQTLQNALALLQIYKQKDEIGVDIFFKPSFEIDQEQKQQKQLWSNLFDRLKHSSVKI